MAFDSPSFEEGVKMTAVFKSSIYFWLAARGSNLDAGPWPCGTPVLHVMQGRRRSLPDSEPFAHLRYDKSHYCSRFVAARSLQVKLDLARSLGKLDLSDCNLDALPEEVTELTELEELSLSGNRLTEVRPLPPRARKCIIIQTHAISSSSCSCQSRSVA